MGDELLPFEKTNLYEPRPGFLHLVSWSGKARVPVTVVGETPKCYRVRLEENAGSKGRKGDVKLVPKYAVMVGRKEPSPCPHCGREMPAGVGHFEGER